jgi:hypothetical protein
MLYNTLPAYLCSEGSISYIGLRSGNIVHHVGNTFSFRRPLSAASVIARPGNGMIGRGSQLPPIAPAIPCVSPPSVSDVSFGLQRQREALTDKSDTSIGHWKVALLEMDGLTVTAMILSASVRV